MLSVDVLHALEEVWPALRGHLEELATVIATRFPGIELSLTVTPPDLPWYGVSLQACRDIKRQEFPDAEVSFDCQPAHLISEESIHAPSDSHVVRFVIDGPHAREFAALEPMILMTDDTDRYASQLNDYVSRVDAFIDRTTPGLLDMLHEALSVPME